MIQPGDPQAPVAVDDVVTVAPGVKLTADVLANDLRSAGYLHVALVGLEGDKP